MLFLRFKLLIIFLKVLINITSVVSTGARRVFAPLGETKPAETMITFLASHVHATLVFLNQARAFWARFGVSF